MLRCRIHITNVTSKFPLVYKRLTHPNANRSLKSIQTSAAASPRHRSACADSIVCAPPSPPHSHHAKASIAMRSGSYIQALGRQSFEPSQPTASDDHDLSLPSEQSHERQRQLIKAQNDVLATVGVCLRDTKQDLEHAENVMAENETGLFLGAVDLTVTYLASWPLIGIRNRLQTYRMYENLRYRDVLRLAWTMNTWGALFSGMPAHLCYQIVNLTKDYMQAKFMTWLQRKPLFTDSRTGQPKRDFWLHTADKLISFGSWFLIYPLWYHSTLQVLHLLPPTPLLPSFKSFLVFSAASPISLPHLINTPLISIATAKSLLSQAATSNFLLSFVTQSISVRLQFFLYHKILDLLPAPSDGTTPMSSLIYIDEQPDIPPPTPAPAIEEVSTHTSPDPASGEIATDPLELAASPPPPPPPRRATPLAHHQHRHHHHHQRSEYQYRNTTLSAHPVDIAASHAADCIGNALLLVGESVVLRRLAWGRGLGGAVYRPFEIGGAGQGLVAKALVVGEWGLMWCLFEVSWGVSTWVGVRWFGYARNV
ncbi:hypothetical protein K440DRAFT_628487 [Wilcoxina mikolae CBS 423.85]|nr:hypothetical protein K440DRAFT_628487 [Wilcoxina mikolae CBS 423.85]